MTPLWGVEVFALPSPHFSELIMLYNCYGAWDGEKKVANSSKKTAKHSRKRAIHLKCVECVGGKDEPGYREEIRRCFSYSCPLREFRPYQ